MGHLLFNGRVFNYIFMLLTVLIFSNCTSDNGEKPTVKTGFSFGQTSLEVPAEGGEFTVMYILENPVEGYVVEHKCEEAWVHDFDLSVDGRVKFTVDSTDVEVYDRTAVLTLVYGDEEISLDIVQKGAEAQIFLDVEQARNYSLIVKIVPKDPEMRVFFAAIKQETMDAYDTDEDVYAAVAEFLKEDAERNRMTLEYYIAYMYGLGWYRPYPFSYVMLKSVYNIAEEGYWFEPGTDYCVFCYGIDEKGEPLTQVYKQSVTTKPLDFYSTAEFDVETEVNGQSVTVSVNPLDDGVWYYYGATLGEQSEDELRTSIQNKMDSYLCMVYTLPDVVQNGGADWKELVKSMSVTGEQSMSVDFKAAARKGKAYAYAIDEMGYIISVGTVEDFTTEDIARSDNEISLTVTDIDFKSALLRVDVTNDDPYNVFLAQDDGGYDGLSLEEQMERIWDNGKAVILNGSGNAVRQIQDLSEATDYIIVAYGWDMGVLTTDPVMTRFSTPAQQQSEVTCEPYVYKYFSSIEAAEKYPEVYGKYADMEESAIVQVRADVTGEPAWYIYHLMWGPTVDNMSDEQLLQTVENLYNSQGPCRPSKTFEITLGYPMVLFGVAMGNDGNYGPIFRKEYTFTKEGMSPIDEFVLE